jgi:hypothetical protein
VDFIQGNEKSARILDLKMDRELGKYYRNDLKIYKKGHGVITCELWPRFRLLQCER